MAYSRSKFGDITSQPKFYTGVFGVGTSAATFGNQDLSSGIRINPEGEAVIAIGHDASVTKDTGYQLDSEVFIDIDQINKVFVVGSAVGSTISFIAS
jgi:hypothetical protein